MNTSTTSLALPASTRPLLSQTAGQALRHTAIALSLLLCAGGPALAQVSLGVSMPAVSIGINMPVYPQLVRVPNYPVYYAPGASTNFFFYDGMYWVYQQDNWYASSWYNGPWQPMSPQMVPAYVLRIPVRYYRNPPSYFRGWQANQPPRWGEHWGNDWSRQRSGWDRWDRRAAPAPAPLPAYQRQYSGDRYPQPEQQHSVQSRNYRYQPRDAAVQHQYQQQAMPPAAPSHPVVQARPPMQQPQQQPNRQPQPQQGVVRHEAQGQAGAPGPEPGRRPGQGQGQGRGNERARGQGQGQEQDRDNGPGQGRK